MTHPKGEVELLIDGRLYVLKYSINVLSQAEEESSNTVVAAFSRIEAGTFRIADVRWLFWSALRTEHPELSLDDAGDLMQAAGTGEVLKVITQAFNAMMAPSRPQKPARKKPGRRPNARIGDVSGSTPSPLGSMAIDSGATRLAN